MTLDDPAAEKTAHRDQRAADRLLVRVIRSAGPWLWVQAVTSLSLSAALLCLPAVLGKSVDAVLGGGDEARWLSSLGLLVILLVACDALADLAAGAGTARSTAWLRHGLLRHVLALGTRIPRRFTAGELASRLVGNAAEAGRVATAAVWTVTDLVPPLGGIVALALIDPWLCFAFLTGVPVLLLFVRAFVRDASELAHNYLEVQGTIAGRLVDALAGARTIAAAGTLDREAERVLAPLPQLHRHGMGMWRAQTRIAAQQAVLVPMLQVAVLAVAGFLLTLGRITPGQVFAATQYVYLAAGLGAAMTSVMTLARARAAAGRTAEILAEPPTDYGQQALPAGPGTLEFRGVTVRSGSSTVLDGIDLALPGGALVAVVGRSGAGKSLLAALPGRLVDPDEGQVRLDGVPLPQLDRRELRRAVGYGFERPVLFGETLAEAIAYGGPSTSPEEVRAAARAARAATFIERMPEGYQTRLTDAPMSGGEVQRIGLARAFAHARRVLVLDDVAASLDTVTEHHISQVLTGALTGRTRLVVAHRASTAARADLVVWLEEGHIRAVGTHQHLWEDRQYRAVFEPGAAGSAERCAAGRSRSLP